MQADEDSEDVNEDRCHVVIIPTLSCRRSSRRRCLRLQSLRWHTHRHKVAANVRALRLNWRECNTVQQKHPRTKLTARCAFCLSSSLVFLFPDSMLAKDVVVVVVVGTTLVQRIHQLCKMVGMAASATTGRWCSNGAIFGASWVRAHFASAALVQRYYTWRNTLQNERLLGWAWESLLACLLLWRQCASIHRCT